MRKSGFTMTEMVVALSILTITLSIGVPSFKNFISGSNMVADTNGMIGAFNYARTEAIKRGNTVNITQVVNGSWSHGVVVYIDADAQGDFDQGEELRLWPAFDHSARITSNNNRSNFSFQASGEVDNDDVLTICDDRDGEQGRQITILVSGAIIAERVNCV